jgi:IPT/TIG domain
VNEETSMTTIKKTTSSGRAVARKPSGQQGQQGLQGQQGQRPTSAEGMAAAGRPLQDQQNRDLQTQQNRDPQNAQGRQGGQLARQQPQPPVDADQEEQERLTRARETAQERERSNNPATRKLRQYDQMRQPGLDPGNQPAQDTRVNKGTRLDLEDLTGNPGHRQVNPDAPANSINGPPSDRTGRVESINEPPGIPNNDRPNDLSTPAQRSGGTGVQGSINEPPGSQVIPEGAGAGSGTGGEGGAQPIEAPTLDSLDPAEIAIGAADTTLHVHGSGFTEDSVIHFAGHDEPTTFVSDSELTTGLKPSLWQAPDTVECTVKNGGAESEPVEFEFLPAEGSASRSQKSGDKHGESRHHGR